MSEDKKIIIGSDHGGFELKKLIVQHLEKSGYEVIDMGCDAAASCDYPEY